MEEIKSWSNVSVGAIMKEIVGANTGIDEEKK